MHKIFNLEDAMERVLRDAEFLKELLELFYREAAPIIAAINQAANEHNQESLQRSAHALTGCAANIGAEQLVSLSQNIEAASRKNDFTLVKQLCSDLENRFEAFKIEATRALA